MFRRRAFSLIELMVVIGIIAILIALLLPTLTRVRLHARQIQCAANLRQLGTGLANYVAMFKGHYPVVGDHHAYGGDGTGEDHEGLAWTEQLEPYYAKVSSRVFHCESFPEGTINYFLGVHWVRIHENRFDLMTSDIKHSSEYILGGDCTHARLYCPPWGQSQMYMETDDCDKDDMLWNCLAYFGEEYGMWAHPAGNNVLFGDYHVAPFRKFDSRYMTYDPTQLGVDFATSSRLDEMLTMSDRPLQLDEPAGELKLTSDARPRLPEPLPVRLVAVDHVRLSAPAGIEPKLDAFYVGLLQFERVKGELAYRADNFLLRFDVLERPVSHESLRPQGIEIASLTDMERKLVEAELEYTRQRGLTPGEEMLVLLDPAGNWLELVERRIVP